MSIRAPCRIGSLTAEMLDAESELNPTNDVQLTV